MNRDFWEKALIRAVRTMAQAAITLIGTDMVNIVSLDWLSILGCTATMGVLSILTSIATGLPEVPDVYLEDESDMMGRGEGDVVQTDEEANS